MRRPWLMFVPLLVSAILVYRWLVTSRQPEQVGHASPDSRTLELVESMQRLARAEFRSNGNQLSAAMSHDDVNGQGQAASSANQVPWQADGRRITPEECIFERVASVACPEHPDPHEMVLANGKVKYWLCLHNPSEDIFISLYLFDGKLFETSKVGLYMDLLHNRPAVTVLDLGANIGYFALLSSALGHRTIALEPMPHNFALLNASCALNGLEDRLRTVNRAGGPVENMPPLRICAQKHNQGDSAVVPSGAVENSNARCHTIPVTTLNVLLKDEDPPMLVKSDTQGFDAAIMDGERGGSILWRVPPAVLMLEWEPRRMLEVSGYDSVVFLRFLHQRGYVFCRESDSGLLPLDMSRIDETAARLSSLGNWYDIVALHCQASPARRAFFARLEKNCPCPAPA